MMNPLIWAKLTKAALKPLLAVLFFAGCLFALFLLIPLLLFAKSYHAIRQQAADFNASPNCHAATALGSGAIPCSIEWANVLNRYYASSSVKSSSTSYRYYLLVRGGYGDKHTVEVKNIDLFWRTQNGIALKLQRWGDLITAVQLTSGESSPTIENPDWQFQNDVHGLRTILLFEFVVIAVAVVSALALRQI